MLRKSQFKIVFLITGILISINFCKGQDLEVYFRSGHFGSIERIKIDSISKKALTYGKDKRLLLWDLNTHQSIAEFNDYPVESFYFFNNANEMLVYSKKNCFFLA